MRNIDKIVESQYPPKQTNVLWFDTTTSELKIYMNGEWVHADGLDEIATDEDIDSITKSELDKRQYFTIETISDNTKLSWLLPLHAESSFGTNIEWSSDEGANWQVVFSQYDAEGNIGTFDAGTKIIFRHDGPTGFDDNDGDLGDYGGSFFFANKPCYVYGNVMSLLFSSSFAAQDDVKYDCALTHLFCNSDDEWVAEWVNFKEGSPLLLPATKLTNNCYACMFTNCLSITTAPELPATTLAFECYRAMFSNCTSLASAPKLPATTLVDSCYDNMFYHCTSLTTAPELPAITLTQGCYTRMFSNCTSLTAAPKLPATTVASHCYDNMFRECTSLAAAPELPATTVTDYCYSGMFFGCTSLTTAPALPATIMANYCYARMFQGCTSLATAPKLPATTLAQNCYSQMFQGCTSLASVKCLASAVSPSSAVSNWLYNVSATGTFTKATGAEWPTGESGIPSGWTVIEE